VCGSSGSATPGIFAGSDTISAALVAGAFLAGLGIGSIIGAKIADRITPARALIGFAIAEIGVGIFALPCPRHSCMIGWQPILAGVVDDPGDDLRAALLRGLCCRPR
jgi:MFS family permease